MSFVLMELGKGLATFAQQCHFTVLYTYCIQNAVVSFRLQRCKNRLLNF